MGEKLLYCSFCGKSQHEVRKLIAGPSVFICDECIDLCNDIIREEAQTDAKDKAAKKRLPTPGNLRDILDQYVIDQWQAKKIPSVAVTTTTSVSKPVQRMAKSNWPSQHSVDRPHRVRQDVAGAKPWRACSMCRCRLPMRRR